MPPAPLPSTRMFVALLPDLRRSARRLSRSVEDADDLVQETLLKVWARLAMARLGATDAAPVTDLRAYAFATMRNCARHRPSPPTAPEKDTETLVDERAGDAPGAGIACAEALEALAQLPEAQRQLISLRAIEGLSYAEIARTTGLPLGTVTSRLARGRAALRQALGLPRNAPVTDLFRPD